jgi:hypothetical protein
MSLQRRVAALEKQQAELAAIAHAKVQRSVDGKFHGFCNSVERHLQARDQWSFPGEEFFSYVAKGIGFDCSRLQQALAAKDRPVLHEFMQGIFSQFPDLESDWCSAFAGV